MQYHALSLANTTHARVCVVAYVGTSPVRDITHHARISTSYVTSGEHRWMTPLPTPVRLGVRVATQIIHLFWILMTCARADDVIIQNPPCVPTFTVCGVACAMRRMRMVVDWHNLAYTLFGMKYGARHWMTTLLAWYERTSGRYWAHEHLCVTRAMGEFLSREWGISGARVVYDRPPEYFRDAARASRERGREAFWRATRIVHAMESSRLMREGDFIDSYVHGGDRGKIKGNEDDVRFVVTSTSWTPDEDFQVLLDAIVAYDARASHLAATASSSARLPRLAIIVTGKGPQKEAFEDRINATANSLTFVAFRTVWLDIADYPHALANADLGVCLHTSSSGLDLPMKVVDMFGASLPVLAMAYDVIHELVDEGVNGALFRDASSLASSLEKCFSAKNTYLSALKRGAEISGARTWNDNWRATVAPAFASS